MPIECNATTLDRYVIQINCFSCNAKSQEHRPKIHTKYTNVNSCQMVFNIIIIKCCWLCSQSIESEPFLSLFALMPNVRHKENCQTRQQQHPTTSDTFQLNSKLVFFSLIQLDVFFSSFSRFDDCASHKRKKKHKIYSIEAVDCIALCLSHSSNVM